MVAIQYTCIMVKRKIDLKCRGYTYAKFKYCINIVIFLTLNIHKMVDIQQSFIEMSCSVWDKAYTKLLTFSCLSMVHHQSNNWICLGIQ